MCVCSVRACAYACACAILTVSLTVTRFVKKKQAESILYLYRVIKRKINDIILRRSTKYIIVVIDAKRGNIGNNDNERNNVKISIGIVIIDTTIRRWMTDLVSEDSKNRERKMTSFDRR